jgi:hypothetical protein
LILNASSILIDLGFGPFAGALTWIFAVAGFDFTAAVNDVLRNQPIES